MEASGLELKLKHILRSSSTQHGSPPRSPTLYPVMCLQSMEASGLELKLKHKLRKSAGADEGEQYQPAQLERHQPKRKKLEQQQVRVGARGWAPPRSSSESPLLACGAPGHRAGGGRRRGRLLLQSLVQHQAQLVGWQHINMAMGSYQAAAGQHDLHNCSLHSCGSGSGVVSALAAAAAVRQ